MYLLLHPAPLEHLLELLLVPFAQHVRITGTVDFVAEQSEIYRQNRQHYGFTFSSFDLGESVALDDLTSHGIVQVQDYQNAQDLSRVCFVANGNFGL